MQEVGEMSTSSSHFECRTGSIGNSEHLPELVKVSTSSHSEYEAGSVYSKGHLQEFVRVSASHSACSARNVYSKEHLQERSADMRGIGDIASPFLNSA